MALWTLHRAVAAFGKPRPGFLHGGAAVAVGIDLGKRTRHRELIAGQFRIAVAVELFEALLDSATAASGFRIAVYALQPLPPMSA